MSPATAPRDEPLEERLLHVDPAAGTFHDGRVGDLPALVAPGDLLVVNDAATVPASLHTADRQIEIRLAGVSAADTAADATADATAGAAADAMTDATAGATAEDASATWKAVLFGPGDWRARTEDRPPPPAVGPGDTLRIAPAFSAHVVAVSPRSPRLVTLRFSVTGAALWALLYRHGRPVQYSYLTRPLALWDTQTAYATRPWAVELPSAGRPLTAALLLALSRRGVAVAAVTHAAGLSSTGEAALDALLPLPERYEIPAATVDAIAVTRAAGRRVIAVGTTVVRALEGAAAGHGGALVAGAGVTDLRVSAAFRPRVVDGLLTGVHDPDTSHFRLLAAFAAPPLLAAAHALAEARGYLGHEFGDSMLIY